MGWPMSERGQSIGGNAIIRAPHITLRNMQRKSIQFTGCNPLHPVTRLHDPGSRMTTHSIRSSMQTGSNLSPDLFASVVAGSHGEENDLALFPSRSALKLAQA